MRVPVSVTPTPRTDPLRPGLGEHVGPRQLRRATKENATFAAKAEEVPLPDKGGQLRPSTFKGISQSGWVAKEQV